MPSYIYGCDRDGKHPTYEIVHGVMESPEMKCSVCGTSMHRVPQGFRWYKKPSDVLFDKYDKQMREGRKRRLSNGLQ